MNLLLSALLSSSFIAQAPDMSQPNTLAKVLDVLSTRLEVKLTVAPELSQRILILRDEQKLGSSLLDLIAKAACGKWESAEGGKRLVLDQAERKRQEDQLKDRLKDGLDRALKELTPDSERLDPDSAAEKLLKKIEGLSFQPRGSLGLETIARYAGLFPADQLCKDLATALGAARWLRQRNGEYVVYCSEPGEGELAFPTEARRVIGAFQEVQKKLAALLENRTAPPGSEAAWSAIAAASRAMEGGLQVLLVAGRSEFSFGARCEVFLAGQNCGTGFCTVQPKLGASSFEPEKAVADLSERSIAARRLFQASGRAISHGYEEPERDKEADLLAEAEPLRFLLPEAMSAMRNGPLMACLPDHSLGLAYQCSAERRLDPKMLARRLQERCVAIEAVGDVLVIRPLAPSLVSGQSDLRKAIKTHLLAHRPARSVPATAFLQYSGIAKGIEGSLIPSLLYGTGWRILRPIRVFPTANAFLASLSGRQLEALVQGNRLPVATLSALQQNLARDWIRADVLTPDRPTFALTGIRRLSAGGPWFVELEAERPRSLIPRHTGFMGQWLPKVAWTVQDWRDHFLNIATETKTDARGLAQSADWWVVEPEYWTFRIRAQGIEGVTASYAWSIPGPPAFRRWDELEESIRDAVLPPF